MWLPLLLGGPDFNRLFRGIRIHMGNTVNDTAGCILVGRNQRVGQVLESRKWLYELKQKIVEARIGAKACGSPSDSAPPYSLKYTLRAVPSALRSMQSPRGSSILRPFRS